MFEKLTLTVSQLNLYIKDIFNQIPVFGDINIKGEISNFKRHTSGHLYMSLKDETGVLRAVMFRSAAAGLDFKPENGMKVIASGRISVYERDGQYQLYINSMKQDGKGDLYAAFEKLKEKLRLEGIFDAAHKKPLPKYPRRVGVVTAPTGAAVRDIINILSRRFSYADIILFPVLVQGENAAAEISAAIEYFNETHGADVLIVGRGGGSIEDLWAFNEETVARAIYASEIPIISAVGHETDFTIADFAADMRAPTPSAAAELAVPSRDELETKFDNVKRRIEVCSKRVIENGRLRLRYCAERPVMTSPMNMVDEQRLNLDHIYKSMEDAVLLKAAEKRQALGMGASKLEALSPLATVSRGFALAKTSGGALLRSIKQVKAGDNVKIRVSDGEISAEVGNTAADTGMAADSGTPDSTERKEN